MKTTTLLICFCLVVSVLCGAFIGTAVYTIFFARTTTEQAVERTIEERQLPIPSTIRMTQWPMAGDGPEGERYIYELRLSYVSGDKDKLIEIRERIQEALE